MLRFGLACLVAVLAAVGHAQQPDVVGGIAAENALLSAQIADAATALDSAQRELARLRKAKSDLEARMQQIERRASVYALGEEFAQTLLRQTRQLRRSEQSAAARDDRDRLMAETSNANLRTGFAADELDDLDTAVATRLASLEPPLTQAQREQAEPAVRAALSEQRDLLGRLVGLQRERLEALRAADDAERDLELRSESARAELTRYMFWIPASPSTKTFGEFAPSLAWTVSPANWRAAAVVVREELARRPFRLVLALLAAASLLALRGPLRRALVSLSPSVVTYGRYRIGHALAALVLTVALAVPIPIALWTTASALWTAPAGQPFALALGDALWALCRLILVIFTFAWLLDRNGLAVRHFGWDEASLGWVARGLRRLALILVPLIFIAALNGLDHAPFANRESLGRSAFALSMVAIATFLVRFLRRGSPPMQRFLVRSQRGWVVRLYPVWFGMLVAVPLAVLALSAAGYFVAAGYFWARVLYSVLFMLGAVMLYGLMSLWVQLQRLRLARTRDEDVARATQAEAPGGTGSEAGKGGPRPPDIAAIGEQTRSLLNLLVTLSLLAGLWWTWWDALPALTVIGDHALWTYTETVGGKEVTQALTVGHLFLALLVVVVTAVAVGRVGALLDILLLQRFEMQADATYAIKVITRYAIAAGGIVLASNFLGIGWSDVQWLVAALSVGLGFGLQEIVANFISGLIVLAERPIRIGDVVTVGDITGTVARIRARATAVIDFDNKEVIIPNKAFITERVVNWTLSNQTTRLLLKVGVAYGSDIEQVQKVLLDAVRGVDEVLQDPPPSVYMRDFGDSSLDFEIRAYVDAFGKRLQVQHRINLEVARALAEHGIEIPFPQRDLHIASAPGLAGALSGDRRG